MKLKFIVVWMLFVCAHGEFFAMELELPNKGLDEVVIKQNNVSSNTIQLLYETFLERTQNRDGQGTSPRQAISPRNAVQHIEAQLHDCVVALKDTNPEMYASIINIKKRAEANDITHQEIQDFIKNNFNQLAPIMYSHLYTAQIDKIELDKKKEYALHEVLNVKEAVDSSTLLHALLYRSASVQGGKEVVVNEVDKSKKCVDDWLSKLQETEPIAYAILVQAYEQVKKDNLTQEAAMPFLLGAVDQLKNVEAVQLLLKDIQAKYQNDQTHKTAWTQASGIIAGLITIFVGVSGSLGGVLGGLFTTQNVTTAAVCTLNQCLSLMNATIG